MSFITTALAQASETQAAQQEGALELVSGIIGWLTSLLVAVLVLVASFIVARILASYIIRKLRQTQGETLHDDVVVLVRRMVTVTVVTIGMGVALQYVLKLDILQIVGFFGLGIGFAFKDILSNLIAGVIVLMQGRFHIGDYIQIGAVKGKVVEIQTRTTILQGFDGTEIIIPNGDFLTKTVRTFTTNPYRRITLQIPVHLRTNLDLALALMKEILLGDTHIVKKPSPKVQVDSFARSEGSIIINARFWIASRPLKVLKVRSDIIRAIKAKFEKHGIEIPFPIYQDYVVEGEEIAKQGKAWKTLEHPMSDSLDHLADGVVYESGVSEAK